ncbi:MAG TPA: type III pantothenate kinase [Burkholderiaceae bacterium]|nr:type III pantothenate kinase [Burkholderiaceae bacterium]
MESGGRSGQGHGGAARWLLLDCGNSALKWALSGVDIDADADAAPGASPCFVSAGREELGQVDWPERLEAAWRRAGVPPAAAYGCSVASSDVGAAIDAVARRVFGVRPCWKAAAARFVAADIELTSGYRDPSRLGADRWHAMIAARVATPGLPLVVVNAGTATTVDAVTMHGRFEGGVIAPGMRLMLDSLARGTARLPRADGAWSPSPDNTDDAITTGVLEAQAGLVERRVRRFSRACGRPVRLVLAGGFASLLAPHVADALGPGELAGPPSIEDNLVLRGVHCRARFEARGDCR